MDVNKWEIEFKKGFSKPFVLLSLSKNPNYPYGIIRSIKDHTNHRFEIAGPNIYPILKKMEKNGLIREIKNEKLDNKTYKVTESGKVFLTDLKVMMKDFVDVIEKMME